MKRTRLNPVNAERRNEAYAKAFGDKSGWIRAQPCCVPRCDGFQIVAAHAIPRGMGGCNGDARHQVPMCQRHHDEAGEHRTSQRRDFERLYWPSATDHGEVLVRLATGYEER